MKRTFHAHCLLFLLSVYSERVAYGPIKELHGQDYLFWVQVQYGVMVIDDSDVVHVVFLYSLGIELTAASTGCYVVNSLA